jgi:Uma2 family endonuclease
MATVLKLGPGDHGRPMTLEEFEHGDYEEGHQYELIDGRLYVSPAPDAPVGILEKWLCTKVDDYARANPHVLNFVYNRARVFIPSDAAVTAAEPDLAAYKDFPLHLPLRDIRWQDTSPILVGEVVSHDACKDLVRNVDLYLQVPTIREYWILAGQEDADRPTLRVYRRHGKRWRVVEAGYGEDYTTKLLPGFTLTIDPRR